MRTLVTGAKGMLGTDLCAVLANDHEVLATDIEEMDVTDVHVVGRVVSQFKPDVVVHLAALTDVDGCELHPDEAFRTNALGTRNVALACQRSGAAMLYMSTISVFDGTKSAPYIEFDVPNPKSVYSQSKYQGEAYVRTLLSRYYIVRTGWLFGGGPRDKKFVAKFLALTKERDLLQVVDDKFGSPTYTRDLAHGLEALIRTDRYGTCHMVNAGGHCSRYQFAQKIVELAGNTTCQVVPISSDQWPLPAPRPRMEAALNYVLSLDHLDGMRPWHDALRDYLDWLLAQE